MFNNSRNSSISRSHFNIVDGDQLQQTTILNIYQKTRQRLIGERGDEDDVEDDRWSKRHRRRSILNDFKEIRRGDMVLLRQVSVSDLVQSQRNVCQEDVDSKSNTSMKIEVVKLATKKRGRRFMALTYEGTHAHQMWRRDLEKYARGREASGWQLYAFSRSVSPSLIFHEELVPFGELSKTESSVVQYYVEWRLMVDLHGIEFARRKYLGLESDPAASSHIFINRGNIWINPSTGCLQWGPWYAAVPWFFSAGLETGLEYSTRLPTVLAPLLQFNLAEAIEDYLQNVIDQDVQMFFQVCASVGGRNESCYIDPYTPCYLGSIHNIFTQEVVGYIPISMRNVGGGWWYRLDENGLNHLAQPECTSDGWFRALYDLSHGQLQVEPSHYYNRIFTKDQAFYSWLAQSPYIFDNIQKFAGIMDDLWYQVNIFPVNPSLSSILYATTVSLQKVYLFLPPAEIIQTKDQVTAQIKPECSPFWSLDPLGKTRMKLETMDLLGIPFINFTACSYFYSEDLLLCELVAHFLNIKGYRADADDFICSQNWPKFQFTRSPDASGTEQIIEGDDDSLEFPSRHHSDNNLMYKSKCYDLNDKEDTRSFHSV